MQKHAHSNTCSCVAYMHKRERACLCDMCACVSERACLRECKRVNVLRERAYLRVSICVWVHFSVLESMHVCEFL